MALLTRFRVRRVATLAALATVMAVTGTLYAQRGVEYEVKAGYISNFVQFVDWPETSWPSGDSPFRICVVGQNPFGDTLDRAVKDEHVNSHPIVVERQGGLNGLNRCQVVFASAREDGRAKELLKAIDSTSVLTVGESRAFLDAGGAVALVLDGGRVRFDVNLRAPNVKDLRVSSKLLREARTTWRRD